MTRKRIFVAIDLPGEPWLHQLTNPIHPPRHLAANLPVPDCKFPQ